MAVGLVQRAIAFLLLPVYARVLTPADYGVVAVLLTIVGAAQYLLSFGLEVAVFRGYFVFSEDEEGRYRYMNTLGLFLLIAPAVVVAVAGGAIALFMRRVGIIDSRLLIAELVGAAAYVGASTMPLALVRARASLTTYVKINAAFAAAQVFSKALFVLVFKWGVAGWVLSDLCAALFMLVVSLALCGHRWSTQFDRSALKGGLMIGVPLLPHLLSHWVLALSDRIVVGAVLDARAVGLYSMGYQFGLLLGIALSEINRAVMPAYGKAIKTGAAGLKHVASMQIAVTSFLGGAMALLGPPLIHLVLPRSYYGAAVVVPSVALGYILYGWYYVPMNVISVIAGDTRFVAIPTLVSAALNIALNIWLVPKIGIVAAGINTAISYGVLLAMVVIYKRFRVQWRLELEWSKLAVCLTLLGAVAVAVWFVFPSEGMTALAIRTTALLAAGALVFGGLLRGGGQIASRTDIDEDNPSLPEGVVGSPEFELEGL